MAKIFVRERRHVGQGAGRPRFAVVAVQAQNLHFERTFLRRAELEKIAAEIDAQIIDLPRGEHAGEEEGGGGKGRCHRRAHREE